MKKFWKFLWVLLTVVLLCSMHLFAEQKRLSLMPDPKKMQSKNTMSYSPEEVKEFLTTNDLRRKHSL
ncbi:MAG: hypothetical protein ACWGN7_07455 [Thermodesulfovibrionales bacterium]